MKSPVRSVYQAAVGWAVFLAAEGTAGGHLVVPHFRAGNMLHASARLSDKQLTPYSLVIQTLDPKP